MLKAYFEIVRPLVVVSYGRVVNGVIVSDSEHEQGVRMDPFIPLVGKATIHYFADDEDCAFINIPHIHPGRDKYGLQHIRLRRLLELTMHHTILVAHIAMEVLQKYAGNDDPPSRKDLCRKI